MMETKKKYDYSISFIRVTAMLFIILCHLSSHYGITVTAQFFNVGVPIFFMISGYLYGDKKIVDSVEWLYKRYIRLVVPAFMWLILWSAINCYIPKQQDTLIVFLNLQGLDFIFTKISDLGHGPWFLTSIMFCYILLLLYVKIEKKHPYIYRLFKNGGVIPLTIFVGLAIMGISTDGALAFFVGFNLKRNDYFDKPRKLNVLIAIVVFGIAITIRLLSKHFFDDMIIHNEILAPLSHIILASSFVVGIKWLFDVMPSVMGSISQNKLFRHIDKISIYVYVCHDQLFGVLDWRLSIYALMPIYFLIVFVVSTLIWFIGNLITKQVDRCVNYCFG